MAPSRRFIKTIKPIAGTHLSDSEIMRILTLDHMELSARTIADQVGRAPSTVSRILRTYDYKTFESRSLTRIRKRKTTIHQDRILLRSAKANDDKAFRDIINISGLKVSRITLHHRLKEVGLFSRIWRRKPFLKPSHKAARLRWAKKHANWTVEDWMKMIWSDESSIVLGRKSRRRRCIRKNGQAYLRRHCDGTVKSGRVSIMVWACFSNGKLGPLLVCETGGVNADAYLQILSEGLATFINELLTPDEGSDTIRVATDDAFLFMHDNAPCHTAKKVQQYLKNQRVPIMKWPAQSPDLNPIENLWVDFKERFHKAFLQSGLQVSTREDVTERCKELLKQVWRDQGADLIMKLVESMPRRVAAVIAAKGDITKY